MVSENENTLFNGGCQSSIVFRSKQFSKVLLIFKEKIPSKLEVAPYALRAKC